MSIPSTIKAQKSALRKSVLQARSLLSSSDVKSSSESITKKLIDMQNFRESKAVSCFLSMQGEVDTDGIVREILRTGKTFGGIREPEPVKDGEPRQDAIETGDLDLIVMPGVAFDSKLARLGYGKGYYDRFVNTYAAKFGEIRAPKLVGVALDAQIVSPGEIPLEEHDRILDAVVTPTHLYGQVG
ncbi:hypothetical protein OPQ81_009634 [Rhizoctonia solani]|nr:hypothetical protein OPQ81_009634 [Rhizoctonia solani]